jgi:hypothetical protein
MKSLRIMLFAFLVSFAPAAFAQSGAQKAALKPSTNPAPSQAQVSSEKATPTEAQQTFAQMKTLAGSWEGPVTVNPLMPGMNDQPIKPLRVTIRVTSRGNAIVHEFQEADTPMDPMRYDHPVTMFYVDAEKLNLVHYCDAGNRPRMTGKVSPDGKSVEFDFADLSGGNQYGHMYHAVFTFIDADHHSEEWTYMMPGDKPIHARMDLHRVK